MQSCGSGGAGKKFVVFPTITIKLKIMYKFIIILLFNSHLFSQEMKVKIIEVNSIDFYYVYKAKVCDSEMSNIITIISNKFKDKESDAIELKENDCYEIKTRLKSNIKTSLDKYLFCNPGKTTINNIRISDESSLPVLILEYKKINTCK